MTAPASQPRRDDTAASVEGDDYSRVVRALADSAPELTHEQQRRLSVLLNPRAVA